MLKYTKILCAFDFDENSIASLHLASALAKESNATLYVGHIARIPNLDMDVPLPFEANPKWERDATSKLAAIAARELPSDGQYQIVVRSGLPSIDILRIAEDFGVDLIVMATHGRRGLKHFVIGSVTEEVIREATCPVLVIRPTLGQKETPPASST